MELDTLINKLDRPTWAEVNLDAARKNVKLLKEFTKAEKFVAVLKADAYGNGAVEFAKAINNQVDEFAVSNYDEAIQLQEAGIEKQIWVFGAQNFSSIKNFVTHDLVMSVGDLAWLKDSIKYIPENKKLKIALAIDTGMNRIGINNRDDIKKALDFIADNQSLDLTEVYTHFATADSDDNTYFEMQVNRWHQYTDGLNIDPDLISMANSATSLFHIDDPRVSFNKIRIGMALSGVNPSDGLLKMPIELEPTFSLFTKIDDVRLVKKGERISYGATYLVDKDQYVATVPIGYGDGWLRRMQDSFVLVDGEKRKIAGRITMDQMMIILDKEYPINTVVTLIGKDQQQQLSLADHAKNVKTISYEIQVTISKRVPRLYKGGL